MTDLTNAMMIAASGMRAQGARMRIISENVANADSVANVPGELPYQRQIVTFESEFDRANGVDIVRTGDIILDEAEFPLRYLPGHPGADENGYVQAPNVNSLVETMDLREAQRSYEANLNMVEISRSMIARTIELLRE
jgi:flagellar basal-body rod protein FlgC